MLSRLQIESLVPHYADPGADPGPNWPNVRPFFSPESLVSISAGICYRKALKIEKGLALTDILSSPLSGVPNSCHKVGEARAGSYERHTRLQRSYLPP